MNYLHIFSVLEQDSVASTDGDYSDIRKQPFNETNDSHFRFVFIFKCFYVLDRLKGDKRLRIS